MCHSFSEEEQKLAAKTDRSAFMHLLFPGHAFRIFAFYRSLSEVVVYAHSCYGSRYYDRSGETG